MKVLVFGSRGWVDDVLIRRSLARLPPSTILVHGAAKGADSIGARIGKEELGFEVRGYPANWLPQGPAGPVDRGAGPKRNALMLERENPDADGVHLTKAYGFSTGNHNKGTLDMSKRLWEAKVRFEIIFP